VLRPLAANDLLDIYDFIAKDSPQAALAFVESIEDCTKTLGDFPDQGVQRDHPAGYSHPRLPTARSYRLSRLG
jgi:plasmid stabilization system protein ParE